LKTARLRPEDPDSGVISAIDTSQDQNSLKAKAVSIQLYLSSMLRQYLLTCVICDEELETLGLIERRAGSGSYVRPPSRPRGRTFGLLIPELGQTEIFEPICQGMARASRATHDELLWGAATRDVELP
jgi:hypothetical protein